MAYKCRCKAKFRSKWQLNMHRYACQVYDAWVARRWRQFTLS